MSYCETLRKLQHAIQNKRCSMLSKGIILLHVNPHPQLTDQTQQLIESFVWKQLDHSPYSPHLAASGYHVFLHLKCHLGSQHHDNIEDVKTTAFKWLFGLDQPTASGARCLRGWHSKARLYVTISSLILVGIK